MYVVIGCFSDGEPGWRAGPGWWDSCSNRAPSRVWLSLLLVQYEMRSCLVACMDGSFECMTYGPLYHGCITPSCIAGEVGIEKTEPCGTEGWRWMRRSKKRMRGRHPNTAKCTKRCWDGAQDGLLRATNHPVLKLSIIRAVPMLKTICSFYTY